jgi:hypothetical protein
LAEFFHGDGLFAVGTICRFEGAEDVVNGVQENAADLPAAAGGALADAKKIIDENIKGIDHGTPSWRAEVGVGCRWGVDRDVRGWRSGEEWKPLGWRVGIVFESVGRLGAAMD